MYTENDIIEKIGDSPFKVPTGTRIHLREDTLGYITDIGVGYGMRHPKRFWQRPTWDLPYVYVSIAYIDGSWYTNRLSWHDICETGRQEISDLLAFSDELALLVAAEEAARKEQSYRFMTTALDLADRFNVHIDSLKFTDINEWNIRHGEYLKTDNTKKS